MMKHLALVLTMAIGACTQPATPQAAIDTRAGEPSIEAPTLPLIDAAGNRMEELTQRDDGAFCTADETWCVQLNDERAEITHNGVTTTAPAFTTDAYEREIWDAIIRFGDNALVGVENQSHQMYSGGEASARHVTLYEVSASGAREALIVPVSGAAEIRACFSQADISRRAEACLDLYSFVGQVSIDTSVSQGAPRIVLQTEAGAYPGARSRSVDSSEAPALTAADLIWAADATCSYRRVATRTGNTYLWDQPLPACSDYLEP